VPGCGVPIDESKYFIFEGRVMNKQEKRSAVSTATKLMAKQGFKSATRRAAVATIERLESRQLLSGGSPAAIPGQYQILFGNAQTLAGSTVAVLTMSSATASSYVGVTAYSDSASVTLVTGTETLGSYTATGKWLGTPGQSVFDFECPEALANSVTIGTITQPGELVAAIMR
jgi:hypothetical protein